MGGTSHPGRIILIGWAASHPPGLGVHGILSNLQIITGYIHSVNQDGRGPTKQTEAQAEGKVIIGVFKHCYLGEKQGWTIYWDRE